jgi:hypothetical protein
MVRKIKNMHTAIEKILIVAISCLLVVTMIPIMAYAGGGEDNRSEE